MAPKHRWLLILSLAVLFNLLWLILRLVSPLLNRMWKPSRPTSSSDTAPAGRR